MDGDDADLQWRNVTGLDSSGPPLPPPPPASPHRVVYAKTNDERLGRVCGHGAQDADDDGLPWSHVRAAGCDADEALIVAARRRSERGLGFASLKPSAHPKNAVHGPKHVKHATAGRERVQCDGCHTTSPGCKSRVGRCKGGDHVAAASRDGVGRPRVECEPTPPENHGTDDGVGGRRANGLVSPFRLTGQGSGHV